MLYILLGAYFAPQLHERIFNFQHRSTSGSSIPSWLVTPGPVLMKRHVRSSKFDPLTDEVHLIEANPQYAHVRYPDGKEDTVALKQLAPKPTSNNEILETNRVVEVDSENPANVQRQQMKALQPKT